MDSLNTSVDIKLCTELTEDALASGLVPFLHSSPGCGKSSIIKAIAKKNNLKLIDLRLSTIDSVDLSGMPMIDKDGQVDWKPFNCFPLNNTPIPEGYTGWLLFLDEMNSASEAVIAAAYNVVLDHRIGIYNLHPNCFIACAGNREEDRAITTEMGSAMTSRLVHLTLEPTVDEWIQNVAIPQKYDFRIPAFLSMNPNAFMDFDPSLPTKTFSCPRTWEFVNKELEWFKQSDPKLENLNRKLPLLQGTLNAGVALEFAQFCKVVNDLPTITNIISNPDGTNIPEDLATLWATVSMCISHVNTKNIDSISKYIKRISDRAMQTLYIRGVLSIDKSFITNKLIREFVSDLSLEIAELNNAMQS